VCRDERPLRASPDTDDRALAGSDLFLRRNTSSPREQGSTVGAPFCVGCRGRCHADGLHRPAGQARDLPEERPALRRPRRRRAPRARGRRHRSLLPARRDDPRGGQGRRLPLRRPQGLGPRRQRARSGRAGPRGLADEARPVRSLRRGSGSSRACRAWRRAAPRETSPRSSSASGERPSTPSSRATRGSRAHPRARRPLPRVELPQGEHGARRRDEPRAARRVRRPPRAALLRQGRGHRPRGRPGSSLRHRPRRLRPARRPGERRPRGSSPRDATGGRRRSSAASLRHRGSRPRSTRSRSTCYRGASCSASSRARDPPRLPREEPVADRSMRASSSRLPALVLRQGPRTTPSTSGSRPSRSSPAGTARRRPRPRAASARRAAASAASSASVHPPARRDGLRRRGASP